eukprot:CAMPEP_0185034676 /NCGR_PEP_ID=MMETSP1103-20130426/24766_1 /TAXON_ID=36769 /ORGANISM="Paraphysomonas bandaiensis, Strain Caron Lab Isolate" /LENGTH=386 /DNA_ID=CAMNT_0027571425 /DNA_START=171 /DNA_END=1331 /DNA_ORIENTATION=+
MEPRVIEYLTNPPSISELQNIVSRIGIHTLLRKKEALYTSLGLDDPKITDDDLLAAVSENPILINRPVVVTQQHIKLCRPSHTVLDILPEPQLKPYTLEDGKTVGVDGRLYPSGETPIEYSQIKVVRIGRVVVVTINRESKRNAVDETTAAELLQAFENIDTDSSVDAAVLTGEGGTFCSGYDLKYLSSPEGHGGVPRSESRAKPFERSGPMGPTRMQLSKPVIAAVEGHAVAGGLELALWCDIRISSASSVFGVFCRRWGVPLVDGGTVRLPRLIGHSRAMDMVLTGRAVGSEEALHIGLVNRVVPQGQALAAALEYAQDLSRYPQLCLRKDRDALLRQWGMSADDALSMEASEGETPVVIEEAVKGAGVFARGKGRGGDAEDIQ